MKKSIFGMLAAVAMMAAPAFGADVMPTKAPPSNPLFSGYPYTTSGPYFGINSIGGGGSVSASGAGINPNSVVSNEIAVGLTVGYTYGNGNVFYAAEAMFDFQNFNGNAPGFSFSGPASFEQRLKIGTPLSSVVSLIPGLSSLPAVPPFPALPGGQVATNIHPYLMAGVREDAIGMNFGVSGNRVWQAMPVIGVGAMGQLSKGLAVDAWAEVGLAQNSICIGAAVVCGKVGNQYRVGGAFLY